MPMDEGSDEEADLEMTPMMRTAEFKDAHTVDDTRRQTISEFDAAQTSGPAVGHWGRALIIGVIVTIGLLVIWGGLNSFVSSPVSSPLGTTAFTVDAAMESNVISQGSDDRWSALLTKLAGGGVVRILTVGGSMTAGISCSGPGQPSISACSWSGRVVKWLRSEYPNATVVFSNQARGGTNTQLGLSTISFLVASETSEPWDLIFCDYSVNDVHEPNGFGDSIAQIPELATKSESERYSLFSERFILAVHELSPSAMLFFTLAQCPACMQKEDAFYGGMHQVALLHKVVLLDFREGCKLQLYCKWSKVDTCCHPDHTSHQAYADAITYLFRKKSSEGRSVIPVGTPAFVATGNGPPQTVSDSASLDIIPVCLKPTTTMSAFDQEQSGYDEAPHDGNWNLYADRPNKPGWIATQPKAVKRIDVQFGAHPMLAVNFLRSYEGMGVVYATVNGFKSPPIQGMWKAHQSTTQTVWFNAWSTFQQQYEGGLFGFGVQPYSNHTLELEYGSSSNEKFKLISVISC